MEGLASISKPTDTHHVDLFWGLDDANGLQKLKIWYETSDPSPTHLRALGGSPFYRQSLKPSLPLQGPPLTLDDWCAQIIRLKKLGIGSPNLKMKLASGESKISCPTWGSPYRTSEGKRWCGTNGKVGAQDQEMDEANLIVTNCLRHGIYPRTFVWMDGCRGCESRHDRSICLSLECSTYPTTRCHLPLFS